MIIKFHKLISLVRVSWELVDFVLVFLSSKMVIINMLAVPLVLYETKRVELFMDLCYRFCCFRKILFIIFVVKVTFSIDCVIYFPSIMFQEDVVSTY